MSEDEVEVHLFAAARTAVGAPVVAVQPGRLGSIVTDLATQHPDFATVSERCSFLVDGVAAHDLHAEVSAGSRVDVLPPFAGG